jgi:hypothetical protein
MIAALVLGWLLVAPANSIAVEQTFEPKNQAVLRTLDKVTARTATVTVNINQPIAFGTLVVVVRSCQETPPEEQPEAAAFIEITDTPPEREARTVYSGWMFASSPSLSALQHPIYDVWLVDCKMASSASSVVGE